MNPTPASVRRVARRPVLALSAVVAAIAAMAGAPAALLAPAAAQELPAGSYLAAVSGDEVQLRCGDSDLMYPVAKLARGQILRVDNEGRGWSRVAYPAGVAVFAPADSVTLDASGKTATVTKPVRLKAVNLTTGYRGSWKDATEQPVPMGTKLTVLSPEAAEDGRGNSAYRVAAPGSARAYVSSASLQRATPEQISSFMAAQGAPAQTSQAQRPEAPGVRPAAPGALTEPMAPPPATTAAAPGAANDPTQPTVIEQKPVAAAPQPLPPSPYERLEAAFDAVRKQPADQAEASELIAEYEAAIAKLDDSVESRVIRPRLQLRLDVLKLQADIQIQLRALSEAQKTISESDKALAARLAEVDKARQYTIVGRLSASTIYDGKRMPLMYRVQAVGGPAPRTLGYLKPDEKLKIESKIGQVVGVVGEATVDPTLKLNIIQPLRIDTLEPATPAPAAAPGDVPSSPATQPAAPAQPGSSQANVPDTGR